MSSRTPKKTPRKGNSFMTRWLKKDKSAGGSSSATKSKIADSPKPNAADASPPGTLKLMGRQRVSARTGNPSSDVIDVDTQDRIKKEASEFLAEQLAKDESQGKSPKELPLKRRASLDDPLAGLSSARSLKKQRKVRRLVLDSDDEDDDVTFTPKEEPAARQLEMDLDDDVDMAEAGTVGEDFNFASLQCTSRTEDGQITEPKDVEIPKHLESHCKKARRKLAGAGSGDDLEDESQSWYEKHPWAEDIRDSKMRRPHEKGYDKTTLYVPANEFGKGGLTPFAQQYWKIKSKNYDVIIFFKKGKFYEIFDKDADVCHKLLGLTWTKCGRADMRFCGVPEIRFQHFASRLIEMGYKVGRVEQTESAVGQKKRKSTSGGQSCCERELVQVLSKATVTDESMLRDHRSRYVLSLIETGYNDEAEHDESVQVAMCYVDAAGGSITIRQFEDDFRRTITERILTNLRPQDIIMDETNLSLRVRKIVKFLAQRTSADIIDTLPEAFLPVKEKELATYINQDGLRSRLSEYFESNQLGAQAYGAMKMYLSALLIDKEVLSLENYDLEPKVASAVHDSPKADDAMEVDGGENVPVFHNLHPKFTLAGYGDTIHMDAPTLNSLELVANSNDGTEKGSLLSFLNKAWTPAGKRLLRRWTASPLVSSEDINCRLQAVTSLIHLEKCLGSFGFDQLSSKLKGKCDLERALPRLHKQATVADTAVMYNDVNKKRVNFFFQVLNTVKSILQAVDDVRQGLEQYCTDAEHQSERLAWLVQREGGAIPSDAMEKLDYFFGDAFDVELAEKSGTIVPSEGAAPDYDQKEMELKQCENALEDELKSWKAKLKCQTIKFFHRGQEPYQLEVPKSVVDRNRPREFRLVSNTKKVERFYTPKLKDLVEEKLLAEEAFDEAKKNVIREFVGKFDNHYETWSAVMKTAAELDALMGLTRTSIGDGIGPMCRPEVLPNNYAHPVFEATELRHPVLSSTSDNFVSNDVILGDEKNPIAVVLTGVNAGGKSTLSRQVGVCALLAQIGCYVPANSLRIRPFKDVFVRMGASDDIARGMSTFMVEMEDVSNILNNASSHSLVIADEVGRGTSTHDGYAIAYATLQHLVKHSKCLTIFSTHYHMLGKEVALEVSEEDRKNIGVYEMAAIMDEQRKEITFLYKFQQGISTSSRGICCARLAGVPAEVADAAEIAAEEFERYLSGKKIDPALAKVLVDAGDDDESLIKAIESL